MKYKCRDAQLQDNEAILEIFNHEVENAVTVLELRARTPDEQLQWFKQHEGVYAVLVIEAEGKLAEGKLAEGKKGTEGKDGHISGFASLSAYRARPGYNTTAESSVYIHKDHRGEGAGRKLLDALVERAKQNGFHTLIARIAVPNEASSALHEACGFELIGVEKEVARKFGKWQDTAIFQKVL